MSVAAIDQLAQRGNDDDVALLTRLSTTDAFANQFGFRRSVVQALVKIDSKSAIGALIGLVDRVDGETQADVVKYLTSVTNQAFGIDKAAWTNWWAANSAGFVIPPAGTRTLAAADKVSPGVTMYYGLPMYATRLVFVMDTSNSMIGFRLDTAKRELCDAINKLRPSDQFTVLVFDRSVRAWQKTLAPADAANKKKAVAFVKKQGTQLMTASFDALEAALDVSTPRRFSFSPTEAPFGGKGVSRSADIVPLITGMNQSRRESILYDRHRRRPEVGSPMDTLPASSLAEMNYGVYRRVDWRWQC